MGLVRRIEVERLLEYIVYALETLAAVDWPREGTYVYTEFVLYLVQQVEWVFTLTVHLVDEDHHGRFAHTADLHQAASLRLHTLGGVNHDNHGIDSRERTERIFGKVLVTRGIEDIDMIALIFKAHHRGGHRDTTLLLDFHPVGCGCLLNLIRLHRTCHVDSTTEEQKFLRQSGLTRIWVRDNRKCSSSLYFVL